MFVIFATKKLNDGTRGRRFNVLGQKGLVRIRKKKNNGWNVSKDDCMTRVNMAKVSVYFEHGASVRLLRHFAG